MNDTTECDRRIKLVFQRLFEVRPEDLRDEDRRGELPRWASLGHVSLVASLEQEFEVEIPLEQTLTMETVRDVKRTIAELCRPVRTG